MKKKKVVVIGGGTGTFTVLSGLKKYPLDLTAIVTMADDGGSTGVLRDELGVLPPGDVRQCLVALSTSPQFLRQLMNYRFVKGSLKGHSFGNLFLSALEKSTGSFDQALEAAGKILRIKGQVIPATLARVWLVADLANGKKLHHQREFPSANLENMKRIYLRPRATANPKAIAAIMSADAVIVGPGDFYSSLVPNFLIAGIRTALHKTRALRIYNCNMMTKAGHTGNFTVANFVRTIEQYVGKPFQYVVYNTKRPSQFALKRYAHKGEKFVELGEKIPEHHYFGAPFLKTSSLAVSKSDPLSRRRTLIRHDPDELAKVIIKILKKRS